MEKVIIIGAGPAGLTAAYELLKKNKKYEVIILEESNEIGGISRTVRYQNNRMDIGGHRFFSKSEEIKNIWNELMPLQGKEAYDDKILNRKATLEKGGPDPEKEDKVMLVRNRVSRIFYLKKFFDYPITMKKETFLNMGFARTVKAGFSYLKSIFVKREEKSLEDFYINRFGKVLYSMFFEKYTEKLWGRHPSEISADWGAQRVKGLSIKAVIKDMINKKINTNKKQEIETSLIEQFWYPKLGPGQLYEEMANRIIELGGKIKKEYKVNNIYVEDKRIKKVKCDNGEIMECDVLISSMPLKDLINGIIDENISTEIINIANGLPYRDFITVGLQVNKLNLINKTDIKTLGNIVPDCWIYVQEPEVKLGRIQIFNNWSPYLVEKPEKNVWIGLEYFCNENDKYWNMTNNEFIEFATNELISMGIINKESVIDSHIEKVKKAYPAYFDTYKDINKVIEYINNLDNLYCIGRNGQHRYNNMDHSMMTAIETVKNIENNIKDKSNIWNVNVEKEYHEEKNNDIKSKKHKE